MGKVFRDWWLVPVGAVAALAVVWLLLGIALWVAKPDDVGIQDMLRLLPDVLRLLKRLATDPELPRRIRVALVALIAFIASPIDLIPDFIPAIGYADDVIITALVLRWVSRTAGADALARQWPGTPDGLAAVRRLCGMRPE
ncbi:MAG TPA: YkvA family protein [Mycobacterium sp.]|nr:YkvA family protein [Mycobacterium sp.]HNF03974.1 YkvA family protein [Mycobacterium sp.]HNM11815.1 YkvA family protein [Mycobacterium sp.]HNM92499.1 YkvA family protein [Mycobacterium sp.]HNP11878.1 YkvA family protein [Mycobacterium sp.]